jgi:PAS domain S-box-containing protein
MRSQVRTKQQLIEERKQTETALQQSERRFRSLFQDSSVGTVVVTPSGQFMQVNQAFCDFLGYAERELVGKTILSITHPEDCEVSAVAVRQASETGPRIQRLEKRYLHKSGRVIWGEVSSHLICDADGKPDHFITQILDITERKRGEEALRRQSEEQYRTLVETSPDGVVMADLKGCITFASQRVLQMYGTQRIEDLLGKESVEFVATEDRQRFLANLRRTAEQGVTRDIEYSFLQKDGTAFPGEISTALVKDGIGQPHALVAVLRDITERHKAQEALQRERQSLWRMLEASDHERQIISYEIHDGLAQYLAAALMQFQIHDGLENNSPGEGNKAYETARELVGQAHAESRRLISEVRPPVIDEDGIATAISELVNEQRRRCGPKIEFHCSVLFGRLPSILENALYRIAQEALTNACKHSQSKKATVTLAQEGHDVRLEVRDSGIGFDPETVGKGHFGLEGIRQRVRLLGGRLTIESTPTCGTLVQVVVPIVERQDDDA